MLEAWIPDQVRHDGGVFNMSGTAKKKNRVTLDAVFVH